MIIPLGYIRESTLLFYSIMLTLGAMWHFSLLTYVFISLAGLCFLIGCIIIWGIQNLVKCIVFPLVLCFALSFMTIQFIRKQLKRAI